MAIAEEQPRRDTDLQRIRQFDGQPGHQRELPRVDAHQVIACGCRHIEAELLRKRRVGGDRQGESSCYASAHAEKATRPRGPGDGLFKAMAGCRWKAAGSARLPRHRINRGAIDRDVVARSETPNMN